MREKVGRILPGIILPLMSHNISLSAEVVFERLVDAGRTPPPGTLI